MLTIYEITKTLIDCIDKAHQASDTSSSISLEREDIPLTDSQLEAANAVLWFLHVVDQDGFNVKLERHRYKDRICFEPKYTEDNIQELRTALLKEQPLCHPFPSMDLFLNALKAYVLWFATLPKTDDIDNVSIPIDGAHDSTVLKFIFLWQVLQSRDPLFKTLPLVHENHLIVSQEAFKQMLKLVAPQSLDVELERQRIVKIWHHRFTPNFLTHTIPSDTPYKPSLFQPQKTPTSQTLFELGNRLLNVIENKLSQIQRDQTMTDQLKISMRDTRFTKNQFLAACEILQLASKYGSNGDSNNAFIGGKLENETTLNINAKYGYVTQETQLVVLSGTAPASILMFPCQALRKTLNNIFDFIFKLPWSQYDPHKAIIMLPIYDAHRLQLLMKDIFRACTLIEPELANSPAPTMVAFPSNDLHRQYKSLMIQQFDRVMALMAPQSMRLEEYNAIYAENFRSQRPNI